MSKVIFWIAIVIVIIVGAVYFSSQAPQQDYNQIDIAPKVTAPQISAPVSTTQENNCDSSYPDVCIPSYPPDLDCGEIEYSNFSVTGSDQHGFDGDRDGIGCESATEPLIQSSNPSKDCSGTARCIVGTVTQIIDGDTIKVDEHSIRFALSSAPELDESGGINAREFIKEICPVGSSVIVDEDDKKTQGSYGRIIGIIYCSGMSLNQELVESGLGYVTPGYCAESEFSNELWILKYGCDSSFDTNETTVSETISSNCDPSYPDFCIQSSPPDLDCKDIPQKKFTVLQPDPHRFDGDRDGIGCESSS
jgi:micrococcal nuclease